MLSRVSGAFIIYSLIFLSIFCGCKHSNPIKEIKLKGLTIQLRSLPDENGEWSYAARLLPDKALLREKGEAVKSALMYRMDSCFYLQAGKKTVYAGLVQPVANGLSGTFEYLVSFDAVDGEQNKYKLVYQDRYLNKEKYVFGPPAP